MTVALALSFVPSLWAFDLEGRVRLEGKLPEPIRLEVEDKHQKDCGREMLSAKLKVSADGSLANAVVWVEGVPSQDLSSKNEFILDQINCEFNPHVQLIPKGATLSILNSDGFLHNVRAFDESAQMLFNDAMPKKGQVLKKRFDKPGRILLRCGLHHWMHAMVIVQDHPHYALTDEKGFFKILDIPDGTYTLRVWHESLGEIRRDVNPESSPLTLIYPAPSNE